MDWMDLIIKGIGSGLSFMEAKDVSDSTLSAKDQWGIANPTSSNPFYNTQSSWNGGDPTINSQMSPQLQQVFDELIWGQLAEGRDPYGKSENMNRLQNLQENNQLGRYGQRGDPYSPKADAGGRQGYDPIGTIGNGTGDDTYPNMIRDPLGVGDYDPSASDEENSYNNLNPNTNPRTYLDEIQQAISNRDARSDQMNRYPFNDQASGDNPNAPAGYDNLGSGGIEEMLKKLFGAAAGYAVPAGSEIADYFTEDYNWMGDDRGLMSPNSRDYLTPDGQHDWWRDQQTDLGSGIPYNDAYGGYGYTTPDPMEGNSGYGSQGLNYEGIDRGGYDRSLLVGNQSNGGQIRSNQGGYDPRGSITGGGDYGFATRLPPQYFNPEKKIVVPRENKIGG